MPALSNLRHERFCRAFIKTNVAARAYLKAGYEPSKPRVMYSAAARLLTHVDVKRRIQELKKQMAARNRITVDGLLEELAIDRDLARRLDQPSAAITATMAQARLTGLLVERKESGAPGDFAAMETAEQVLDRVRAELGDATADALAASLARADAAPAQVEQPAEPEVLDPTRAPGDTLQ
jgi:phage terminase small subunit